MTLRSLLVDFNSYFASVEQQVEPRLRGRPVGVVPMMADTTVCIAASIEAKTFGVKTGTKVGDAKRLCPGIELVIARHSLYIDFHHRAVAAVDTVVPVRQVLSIDEMDCELSGRWREPERALGLARKVKETLRARVGECLRTSIGIGPNVFIAKTASDMMKPDGLVLIEKRELPQRLYGLGVRDLSGIGRQMEKRLAGHGIRTVEVSADGGRSWRTADLGQDLGRFSFRPFALAIQAEGKGPQVVLAKATNKLGASQAFELVFNPAGYHNNVVSKVTLDVG